MLVELLKDWFVHQGLNATTANMLARGFAFTLIILLAFIANFVAKRVILKALSYVITRSRTKWGDALLERKVLTKLSHLAPALVFYLLIPLTLEGYDSLVVVGINATQIYMIIMGMLVIDSFLNAAQDIYGSFEVSREIPIRSFVQALKIVIYFTGGVFLISIVLNKTPVYFLSGLGAMTAVLMLIFKDAILGFVAGIQLTVNKMVSHGDWIEMPRYGADGDVLEITLTTVKVQNWDKTITMIPTYALIGESFKNWRGMQESGGRRIKRAVNINLNTIKFCTEEMLERFSKIRYIPEYIEKKRKEFAEYNTELQVDDSRLANSRQLTNIGTFRAYVVSYLRNHPMINQDMTFLIRQLKPTEYGLPIEIYVFCKDIAWANYEATQADIFDHIFAVLPEFDLNVYQIPAGSDFRESIKNESDRFA